MKKDETFVWVVDNTAAHQATKRSVWDRLVGRSDDDDDDDMPGPNAGATLWPGWSRSPRKSAAAFA